jgi:vacuolar-type H+-ATPase subunit E/Vma4
MDPTSDLGESVAALGIQFESLFKTIFGQDATIATVFEVAGVALGVFIDLLHDLTRIVQNIIIFFQVMGEAIHLFFTDMEAFFAFDQGEELKKRIDLRDRLNGNSLAVKQYIAEWDKARDLKLSGHITGINRTADAWERANRAASLYSRPKGLPASADAIERWLNVVAPKTEAISTDISNIVSGGMGGGSTAEAKPTGPTGIFAWLAKTQEEATIAERRIQLIAGGLSEAVADAILSANDPIGTANDALFLIATGGLVHINTMTEAFKNSAAGQALAAQEIAKAAEEATEAAEKARQKEQEILDKRKAAFESFSDSVKSVFGGIKESIMSSFSLPDLGNSVNSITRNIKKLLERTRDFAKNITSLSKQGLSNELLQQIIAAGPIQGGRLAQALAGAGGGVIGGLNQAFGEFGGLASQIAGVGTRSAFGNAQVVNTYNIEVNGGVGSGPTIGKAIVDAIKSYERTSGAVWQGAA